MTSHHLLGQSELASHLPDFILEQLPKRLEQLEGEPLRKPANIMMCLDGDGGAAQRRQMIR